MHDPKDNDAQRVPVTDGNEAPDAGPEADALLVQLDQSRAEQLRLLAEMDNLRKRVARDVDNARKFGAERLLGDLMPVCDSLEAGLRAGEAADPVKLREGLQLTWRLLQKALEGNGLRLVDPLGEPFDPQTQQAVNTVESGHYPPGTVAAVLQKGYVLNDRLLRPALVSVAAEPAPPEDA